MQVDEEVKGAGPGKADLEIGGYEDDSDDEREIREQEEGQKDVQFRLNEAGKAHAASVGANASTMLVCISESSQCLAKIMYAANWQEVGHAVSTRTSNKGEVAAEDKKPKTILTLFALNNVYFALPATGKMGTDAVNPVVGQLFG